MSADIYNILIGTVRKLVSNLFDKEKRILYYDNLQHHLRLVLKQKKQIVH